MSRDRHLHAVPDVHEVADHTHVAYSELKHPSSVQATLKSAEAAAPLSELDDALEAILGQARADQVRAIIGRVAAVVLALVALYTTAQQTGLL